MTDILSSSLSFGAIEGESAANKVLDTPNSNCSTINNSEVKRPIHYLGSKLRLLDELDIFVHEVCPNATTFCDLFAGSGTVSQHFIKTHDVTSVDIQEYSRVITSAVSAPKNSEGHTAKEIIELARESTVYSELHEAFGHLIKFEHKAIDNAQNDELEMSCDLLEDGCLEFYKQKATEIKNRKLKKALKYAKSVIERSSSLTPEDPMVSSYFGGIYFSYEQAVHIDSLLSIIFKLPAADKDTFLAPLLSTVSDIVNTVGKQFAQPIKPRKADGTPKASLKSQLKKDRYKCVFKTYEKWLNKYILRKSGSFNHTSIKSDYAIFLKNNNSKIDIFYADPPYTRDHYSRYYHVLETICLRDNPKISTVKMHGQISLSRGIYREERHQSPFCIKSQATFAFDELFEYVSKHEAPLLLSYSPFAKESNNHPRVLGVDVIEELAKKHFNSVEIFSIGEFSHSKLNHSEKNLETVSEAEILIVCK